MSRSGPTLHPPVLTDRSDIQSVAETLATMVRERHLQRLAPINAKSAKQASVPIDSVSKNGSFDAYIHVGVAGTSDLNIKLLLDSGNSTLILPHFEAIKGLPGYR